MAPAKQVPKRRFPDTPDFVGRLLREAWVYLLDALAEGGLVAWWVLSYVGPPRAAAARPYAHVQQLLNRGRSVSPSPNGPGHPVG